MPALGDMFEIVNDFACAPLIARRLLTVVIFISCRGGKGTDYELSLQMWSSFSYIDLLLRAIEWSEEKGTCTPALNFLQTTY